MLKEKTNNYTLPGKTSSYMETSNVKGFLTKPNNQQVTSLIQQSNMQRVKDSASSGMTISANNGDIEGYFNIKYFIFEAQNLYLNLKLMIDGVMHERT